jgi:hypothetical protein
MRRPSNQGETASTAGAGMFRKLAIGGFSIVVALTLFGSLLTGCKTAGIDSYISADGYELKIVDARLDKYPLPGAMSILVVKCEVKNGGTNITELEPTVRDNKGFICKILNTSTDASAGTVEWSFVVLNLDAKSFVLGLPGGQTVKLDSLL